MDDYPKHDFEIWSSTPAVVWTANRAQELGIHVHVYDGARRIVDDTFGEVAFRGKALDRKVLWQRMTENTIY